MTLQKTNPCASGGVEIQKNNPEKFELGILESFNDICTGDLIEREIYWQTVFGVESYKFFNQSKAAKNFFSSKKDSAFKKKHSKIIANWYKTEAGVKKKNDISLRNKERFSTPELKKEQARKVAKTKGKPIRLPNGNEYISANIARKYGEMSVYQIFKEYDKKFSDHYLIKRIFDFYQIEYTKENLQKTREELGFIFLDKEDFLTRNPDFIF